MDDSKRERGRPPGRVYQHKVFADLSERQWQLANDLARARGMTRAELFRRLIEEEAERKGVS